ncbi:DeoR family transcriptional regulator, partial [Patescibacteria group bacterium]|nr:DeoR family transcriptional regulator [Patescibacteria group bacterium]
MNDRQAYILSAIIDEYIDTAQPVASKTLVEKYDLGVSPATARNDMVHLEKIGYLRQPHPSSGRVPTEDGYRFYLETCVKPDRVKQVC